MIKPENISRIPVILDVWFLSIGCIAYDVQKLLLQKDQKICIKAHIHPLHVNAVIEWYSNNDPVLDITADNRSAVIKATQVGKSTVELKIDNRTIRTIDIIIVKKQAIATHIEITASDPVKQ